MEDDQLVSIESELINQISDQKVALAEIEDALQAVGCEECEELLSVCFPDDVG
jgi:hypothetical protein